MRSLEETPKVGSAREHREKGQCRRVNHEQFRRSNRLADVIIHLSLSSNLSVVHKEPLGWGTTKLGSPDTGTLECIQYMTEAVG